MGLDPNIVLQMLMQKRFRDQAQEQDNAQRQAEIARLGAQREFELGLMSANDPEQNTDALINTFQYLTPVKANYLREHSKTVQKRAKAQEAAKTAGLRATAPREDVHRFRLDGIDDGNNVGLRAEPRRVETICTGICKGNQPVQCYLQRISMPHQSRFTPRR